MNITKYRVGEALYFEFTNEKNSKALRHAIFLGLIYNHDSLSWQLEAFDLDRKEYRSFSLSKIKMLKAG